MRVGIDAERLAPSRSGVDSGADRNRYKRWVDISSFTVATLSGNSLRQTVHTHCASVHQVAKLKAALLRVAGVTASLAESNGSLLSVLWLTSAARWLPWTGISSGTLRSVIDYGLLLPLPFTHALTIVWHSRAYHGISAAAIYGVFDFTKSESGFGFGFIETVHSGRESESRFANPVLRRIHQRRRK